MNSELIEKLKKLIDEKYENYQELKDEYESLTKIDHTLTKADITRIKEIRKEINKNISKASDIKADIDYLEELDKDIEELESSKETITSVKAKEIIESELETKKEARDSFVSTLKEKYDIQEEVEDVEDLNDEIMDTEVDNKKSDKKKVVVSVIAVLLALGIGLGIGRISKKSNNKENSNNTPSSSVSDVIPTPIVTPEVIETLKFTDISDEEQLNERSEEILADFNEIAPELELSTENVKDILNYINGGVVNETSREAALFAITQVEELMNNEMNYSVDYLNKGESNNKKPAHTVDYTKFYLDGSLGQKLAKKIVDLRSEMINNPEKASVTAKEFTKLLMNSWYLDGNDEISAYALETSGMEVLTDKLFLSTAMLAGTQEDLTVINPLTKEEETLEHIIDEINKNICPQEMEADNGEIFTMYVNKFSYDMEGMLKEAIYNKQAYEEDFGRTLTLN